MIKQKQGDGSLFDNPRLPLKHIGPGLAI